MIPALHLHGYGYSFGIAACNSLSMHGKNGKSFSDTFLSD